MTVKTRSPAPSARGRDLRLTLSRSKPRDTVLDGGWWPRSTDPTVELPLLIPALDKMVGTVVRLMLNASDWTPRPRQIVMSDRIVKLGWYSSQPRGLLTVTGDDGRRADLLVIRPGTDDRRAAKAFKVATAPDNLMHTPEILAALTRKRQGGTDTSGVSTWEDEGGPVQEGPDSP